jgi:hypothetical protein
MGMSTHKLNNCSVSVSTRYKMILSTHILWTWQCQCQHQKKDEIKHPHPMDIAVSVKQDRGEMENTHPVNIGAKCIIKDTTSYRDDLKHPQAIKLKDKHDGNKTQVIPNVHILVQYCSRSVAGTVHRNNFIYLHPIYANMTINQCYFTMTM